jgi:O-antigen/teichoic acid export membrane protein
MIKNFQVKKYFLFNALNLIGFIINFGLLYYLNLFLLDELFGIFFITYTILNTVTFSLQPIAYHIIKEISLKNEQSQEYFITKTINTFFIINLVITSVLIIFIFFFNQFKNIESYYLYIGLFLSISGYIFYDILRAILEGLNKIVFSAFFFILNNFIKLCLILFVITYFTPVYFIFYSIFLAFIIVSIGQSFILKKYFKFELFNKINNSVIDLKKLFFAYLFYFFMLIMINFDLIICYFIFDKKTLAVYASSSILAKSINTLFNPIYRIFIPIFSLKDNNELLTNKITSKKYSLFFLILILLFLIGFILIKDFYLNSNFVFKNMNYEIFEITTYSIFPLLIYRFILLKGYSTGDLKSIVYAIFPMSFFIFATIYFQPDILSFSKFFLIFSLILPIYYWSLNSKKKY